jgi:hypothetical protein
MFKGLNGTNNVRAAYVTNRHNAIALSNPNLAADSNVAPVDTSLTDTSSVDSRIAWTA